MRLAIADPTNVVLLDELRMSLDLSFDLVVGGPSAIRTGIDTLYASSSVAPFLDASGEGDEADEQGESIDAATEVEGAPAVEEVNRLLRRAIELGASDLHSVPRKSDLHVRARVMSPSSPEGCGPR